MGYWIASFITALTTALCAFANPYLDHSNLIMIYLLAIVFIATRFGRGPSVFASVLSVAGFDFFCVQPHYSLAVSDWQYVITFAVMLTIAVLITTLTAEAQHQSELDRAREKRSEVRRALSNELSLQRNKEALILTALKHIRTYFDAQVGIYMPAESGSLAQFTADQEGLKKVDHPDNEIAIWVFENKQICGLGKGKFANAASLYIPLLASQDIVGVLQISPSDHSRLSLPEDLDLLESMSKDTSLCIEVAKLAEQAQSSAIQIEREQLRNILLSSVSHDLRTPLATITGASSSLVENSSNLNEEQKQELAEVILEEAEHLNKLVRNLLEMTRLESGQTNLAAGWHSLEELIGSVLSRLERQLKERQLAITIPEDLPLVYVDEILIQQVLMNLLENAIKYTPKDSPIEITCTSRQTDSIKQVSIIVADQGPGLKEGEEKQIFNKFFRSKSPSAGHPGVGLGLAICKAILQAHGAGISAGNRPGGGAEFRVDLPLEKSLEAERPLPESSISGNNEEVMKREALRVETAREHPDQKQ